MTTENISITEAQSALVAAEQAYHSDSSSRNWQAVEKAQSAISQLETKARIDREIAAKKAADERAVVRAAKKKRLDELTAKCNTINDRIVDLGTRIGNAILTAKDLVLVEEVALYQSSHDDYWEAKQLAEELGETPSLASPLTPNACTVVASETCQRAMPGEGVSPWILSQYAGKYWA